MPGRVFARVFLASVILAVGLSACRPSPASLEPGDAENPIAPEFSAFWENAGGLATFGPPLEPAERRGGVLTQTFLGVQFTYHPDDKDQPIRLAPLGVELGLAEPATPPIDGQSGQYFPATGHTLYTGFAPLFGALGGLKVVGAPISEVRFQSGKITQYFENLGMVRPENASPSDVRLLPLGLALQPGESAFGMEVDQVVLPDIVRERPFAQALERHGGEAVLGQPLTDPYVAEDGDLEQVYERAIVHAERPGSRTVRFRPAGLDLWSASPPVAESKEDGTLYVRATGHNILYAFADFYREHDGAALLGDPLEEVRVEGNGLAQRFENGELVYRYDLPPELAVQLAPIGQRYRTAHPAPSPSVASQPTATVTAEAPRASSSGEAIRLEVTLGHAVVHPDAAQEISVRVTAADGKPIEGIRPRIAWYGVRTTGTQLMPASGRMGWSTMPLTVDATRPFEIITLVVSVQRDSDRGSAVVQYAIGIAATK
jgi:hypothetical protein